MEFTGEVVGISKDWKSGKWQVTFSVNEEGKISLLDCLNECKKLLIKATKYREKRSLDANAYFHVLVGKLADVLEISKPRCKNILLGKYGQTYFLDNGNMAELITNIDVSEMLEREDIHCSPMGEKKENGMYLTRYRVVRGSHTYDSKEMHDLISGTVEDCKEMGIDTLTPSEIKKLEELWGQRHETA